MLPARAGMVPVYSNSPRFSTCSDGNPMKNGFFDDMVSGGDIVKSGLCVICKGAHRLCGKDRCPLMIKYYSRQKSMPALDMTDIAGSSPPAVFVGRYGYPKVDIGPLVPGEFGDTYEMDHPELWGGKSIDEIVDFRFRLVRGRYRIDATDFAKSGRIVEKVRSLALTERPLDVEAEFSDRPSGHIVLDSEVQPFGPSAHLERMSVGTGRWERHIEKGFHDTDMKATDAVLQAYREGSYISDIQKAFSVGAFGEGPTRRFVPTRWSITAVDDIIGKDFLSRTRFYDPIGEYRVYYYEELDNRWAIVMLPTTWRFELIEAWYPGTSWNPMGREIEIVSSAEFLKPRTKYAEIGGCYYASRMAVNELLQRERHTAGVVICREAHPGYVMPVGVWNVRENVRRTLKTIPMTFESLDGAFDFIDTKMDIKRGRWYGTSEVFRDFRTQRRIDDFYGRSASTLSDEVGSKESDGKDVSADILNGMNIPEFRRSPQDQTDGNQHGEHDRVGHGEERDEPAHVRTLGTPVQPEGYQTRHGCDRSPEPPDADPGEKPLPILGERGERQGRRNVAHDLAEDGRSDQRPSVHQTRYRIGHGLHG